MRSLTPFRTSMWHRTLYNHTSMDQSRILNAGHVGHACNVIAVAVYVAARDWLAADGDGRPPDWQNSWELLANLSSSNKAAETITRIVGPLDQFLWHVINELLIPAALIIVRLCHHWVRTSWVDSSANYASNIVYHFALNLWQGKTEIRIGMTKDICACIIDHVIDDSCIALTLGTTSWTKLWQDPKLACFPGRHTMVYGRRCEGNECWVDFIHQWSIFHSHLSYAIEAYAVNTIHNFSGCKSKLALLNWSSR